MASRETVHNAYAKFCGDKQRELWYVMVFSVVVSYWQTTHLLVLFIFIRYLKKFKMPSQALVIEKAVPLADVTIYNVLFTF